MNDLKQEMLRVIERRAYEGAWGLSTELMSRQPADIEAVQAGLQFERWLAAACQQCLAKPLR